MANGRGLFDTTLVLAGWFSPDMQAVGIFSALLLDDTTSPPATSGVFFENMLNAIEMGMKAGTASTMGGVLIE